jgi:hypothetical protein
MVFSTPHTDCSCSVFPTHSHSFFVLPRSSQSYRIDLTPTVSAPAASGKSDTWYFQPWKTHIRLYSPSTTRLHRTRLRPAGPSLTSRRPRTGTAASLPFLTATEVCLVCCFETCPRIKWHISHARRVGSSALFWRHPPSPAICVRALQGRKVRRGPQEGFPGHRRGFACQFVDQTETRECMTGLSKCISDPDFNHDPSGCTAVTALITEDGRIIVVSLNMITHLFGPGFG